MNLLFDLDGTLTDPFEGITKCIVHALKLLDRPAPSQDDLAWCIGPPLKGSFVELLESDDTELIDQALAFYRERFGRIGLYENEVYEGIPEALETLQANGHILFVATSKPAIFAERIVEHFSLQRFFKKVYGAEPDGTRTEKPLLLAYLLEQESIQPSDTVMIGDRKHDIIGANENDIPAYGVLWGYGSEEELNSAGARALLQAPRDLMTALP